MISYELRWRLMDFGGRNLCSAQLVALAIAATIEEDLYREGTGEVRG